MNTSYEKLSVYNTFFGGSIDGDNILSSDFYGNKTVVGVTLKKYQDTLDLLNIYYNKLVELGVIEKEKTPEEVAKEQQDMMKALMLQMQAMQEKIDSMNTVKQVIKDEANDECEYKSNQKHSEQIQYESSSTTEPKPIDRKGTGTVKFSQQSDRSSSKS